MSVSSEVAAEASPADARAAAVAFAASNVYGRAFWCAYLSNLMLMVAYTLLYRYADFVLYLGGTAGTVGTIVGVGMVGSLVMRLFQGTGIDRFGARKIWMASMVGFIVSLLGHVFVERSDGAAIYLLRVLYSTSVAGAFGASITSVSRSLPVERMAEVIGSLGTSGFIGMVLGPQLGDVLCGHEPLARADLDTMFYAAAALGAVSLVLAELSTRGEVVPRRRPRKPHMLWLLRRYHPGAIMMLGVVIGTGFVIPTTFLPTYTLDLGIERTGPFFIVYATVAFITRLATRRMPQTLGIAPMIYGGLAALAVSLVCYLGVSSAWGLALPAVFAGVAHAVLYPASTAQGSSTFPSRYRGLGTTLMLATLDLGALCGAPLIGFTLDYSATVGLPPYETTFVALAIGVVVFGTYFAFTRRKRTR